MFSWPCCHTYMKGSSLALDNEMNYGVSSKKLISMIRCKKNTFIRMEGTISPPASLAILLCSIVRLATSKCEATGNRGKPNFSGHCMGA